ncbi:protein kinase C and casein kinase substrate in neurons protein 2, partial [Polyodon spathula]|uniref:protein kinase C and casein kinase substrate in neurons protein 2 n=1 Tax=Polyodon spathula TaxID=7913 RepID=UPI001B7EECD3
VNWFLQPGNYQSTVNRVDDAYQACNDIIACFQDRAKIERQYAQQLTEWTAKWRPLVDASPLYGSLLKAWQCFLCSADRLSLLHSSICRSLVSEDGDRVRSWQKEMFHRKIFGGFRESHDLSSGFARAQKPWAKKLKKLEKARVAFHKASRKEHQARGRESGARGNPDIAIEKQKRIQEDREKCTQHTVKVLEDASRYAPRYMEEMESVFEQSQQLEQKRISFLKQAFLSIHRHLDITNNESIRTVYNELHQTIMSISDHDDLRWWKNRGPSRPPLGWVSFPAPFFTFVLTPPPPPEQEWSPEKEKQKKRREKIKQTRAATNERGCSGTGVRVRALYDYNGQEPDELTLKAGQEFLKVEEEDDQGWCRGITETGLQGLYPANYAEIT